MTFCFCFQLLIIQYNSPRHLFAAKMTQLEMNGPGTQELSGVETFWQYSQVNG